MKFACTLPSLVCVAMLSACATTSPPADTPIARAMSVKVAMIEANAAALAGRPDKAYALLRQAGATYPADKAPWVRMAQMRFDSNNYGEAIVNALEALHRDPDDTVANSVVAVSGLRLSSKALVDLTRKNNLTGTVRTEAQDLAKLLRNSLGEEVLVPTARNPVRTSQVRPNKGPTTAAGVAAAVAAGTASAVGTAVKSNSGDPFGALK